MDEHTEGLVATWAGAAMTLVAALAGFVAFLFPQRQILWGLVVVFAVSAALCFVQVWRVKRRAARRAFTSDGLDWRTIGSGVLQAGSSITMVNVTPDGSGGPLPQPLSLRITCSQEPKDAWATFYADARNMNSLSLSSIPGLVEGQAVYIEFKEPKLQPPGMLAVTLLGQTEEEVGVEKVEHRVSA